MALQALRETARRVDDATLAAARHARNRGEQIADNHIQGDTVAHRAAQEATVLSVVTIAVIGIVGILIYSEVNSALPDPSNPDLNNSTNDLTSGFGNAMGLLPVVLIVLVAAVVIGVVQNFRG